MRSVYVYFLFKAVLYSLYINLYIYVCMLYHHLLLNWRVQLRNCLSLAVDVGVFLIELASERM